MWEINLADQIVSALCSLPLGAFFGLMFFTSESFNIVLKTSKVRIFFKDILFFIVTAFITFCFLIYHSNGEIRGYILLGIGVGFFLFKALLSKCYIRFLSLVITFFKSLIDVFFTLPTDFFRKLPTGLKKVSKKLKIILKKG